MTSSSTEGLLRELALSKEYRAEFVVAYAKHSLPLQVRDLMQQQGLTQTALAKRAELPQGTVSRAANPAYGNLTINTLVRIAAGFDVAFVAKFVPFSEFVRGLDDQGELRLPRFNDEFTDTGEPRVDAGAEGPDADAPAAESTDSVPSDKYRLLEDATQRGKQGMAKVTPDYPPPVVDKSDEKISVLTAA